MIKEIRVCAECDREKPHYTPTATRGYGPHSYNRDDYCNYCHEDTKTVIKMRTIEPKQHSIKRSAKPRTPIPTTRRAAAKAATRKCVPTDKYAATLNTYAKSTEKAVVSNNQPKSKRKTKIEKILSTSVVFSGENNITARKLKAQREAEERYEQYKQKFKEFEEARKADPKSSAERELEIEKMVQTAEKQEAKRARRKQNKQNRAARKLAEK